MSAHSQDSRDVFRLSLGGVTALNSFGLIPAVADTAVEQGSVASVDQAPVRHIGWISAVEEFLARYYAPGCC